MELPQVEGAAPADSPLGLLQRGRGEGWLSAVAAMSSVGLVACLAREPRWDRQVEDRGDYYASLAIRLNVTVAEIASITRTDDDGIVREVVEALARRGVAGASTLLAQMERHDDAPPWPGRDAPAARLVLPPADAPVAELLGADWRMPLPKAIVHRLRTTKDPRELEALRDAAGDPATSGWRLAVRVLALRGDAAALPVVEQILVLDELGSRRGIAFGYVTALPADLSLPLARTWLPHPDGRGAAAAAVLARHAEPSDAGAVSKALLTAGDYSTISSLVEALGRCPEAGPFRELDHVYVGSAYSYARARAVTAMAATDPEFAEKWATECLWDCEPRIRVRGAATAPLSRPVVDRLSELAQDPHQDAEVRQTAATRLDLATET